MFVSLDSHDLWYDIREFSAVAKVIMTNLDEGILLKNEKFSEKYFCLTVMAPHITEKAKPGQFVQIKCGGSFDPYLRRSISVHRLDKKAGVVEFLIEKKGKGTSWLSRRKTGDKLDLLGPLGKEFNLQKGEILLVGGGIGVAPLLALGESLRESGNKPITLLGASTGKDILKLKDFIDVSQRVQIATIDGSMGKQGLVTDLLTRELENCFKGFIYTCGPELMINEVAKIAGSYALKGEASLEANMACGFGVCLGCTCGVKKENGKGYMHVCTDGPVFPLEVLASYGSS